ncbi:uncharacterized protein N7487_001384 [Penicillium crustosum]|uniref:uncharacterized protein n=1 Tax=Penicillium crustosum TaxID=36656 RepID=UPI002394FF12|nr:uncharacterized protein N7487_001384 [Penicillium crustosum]KAJ5417834.1 hypothetical protein N7487_001384 [Penicillium crustosum]
MALWSCTVCWIMYFSCQSWDYIELDTYTLNRIQSISARTACCNSKTWFAIIAGVYRCKM